MRDAANRRGVLKLLLQKPTRTLSFALGWAGGHWAAGIQTVPADRQILLWTCYTAAGMACVWFAAWWLIHGRGPT